MKILSGEYSSKSTVIDYLREYGDYSFREKPMTDVDSLALCLLSYLKFDGLVPDVRENGRAVTLKSLAGHPGFGGLFADVRFEKVNRALVREMLAGRRFGSMQLNCYVNVVEKRWETQFSAVTCFLDDSTVYVAYRGTDESIVGWKEALNLAFLTPVPGQEYGVKYLNLVAERLHRPFYLGGHSKGGNLAVYSAMKCLSHIQERIIKVYSMDGPGLRPEVLEDGSYDLIADRVVKILPHSSVIGMLFESDTRFQVVRSKTFGLAQHDPYTWLVEKDHLARADDTYEKCRFRGIALNQWILSLNERQLRTFVDTLYQVISGSQADDLIEFVAKWKRSLRGMLDVMREVDTETISTMKEIVGALFAFAGAQMRWELTKNVSAVKGKLMKQSKIKFFPHRS